MDSLITAAARALAAGDPLGALNRVAFVRLDASQEAAKPIWDEIAPIASEEFTEQVIEAAS